ncbi:hypothetical protein BJY24_001622 [Nocardia transvalensis]|uniref:Uncharacterized protein n=1 Tax=Nocardia transvalensis TaxID=37333 RepID=A0A7W9PB44_9NOCA|nr:hypothetical protein [Nocardia transvalensis]MBB5912755.1 hypothetical protein [Nocardia transvalensis]
MSKSGSKFWILTIGLLVTPLALAAPAAAEAVPLTPEVADSATTIDAPPCVNYPGNIPCNLSTLSSSIGIGR